MFLGDFFVDHEMNSRRKLDKFFKMALAPLMYVFFVYMNLCSKPWLFAVYIYRGLYYPAI